VSTLKPEPVDAEPGQHEEPNTSMKEWRESIAAAVGVETSDIKTVKELLECDPVGACEAHERCWTHSEWQRCGSLIQSVSSDPCAAVVDGLDGLCSGCREFKLLCEQHDETVDVLCDNRISAAATAKQRAEADVSDQFEELAASAMAAEQAMSQDQRIHMRHAQRINFAAANVALDRPEIPIENWTRLVTMSAGPCPCGECAVERAFFRSPLKESL
jgi:hypothetical protein